MRAGFRARPRSRHQAGGAKTGSRDRSSAADVRYKTKYTTGDQVTDSATFITDHRERYELGDVFLIKQHDQKRNVQISKSANTDIVVADDTPAVAAPAARSIGPLGQRPTSCSR